MSPVVLRTYSEAPRLPSGRLCCYDCNLPYGGLGWCDVLVPDEIWERISPSVHHGAGLLCFNCIARRLAALEIEDVPLAIKSGPFSETDLSSPADGA